MMTSTVGFICVRGEFDHEDAGDAEEVDCRYDEETRVANLGGDKGSEDDGRQLDYGWGNGHQDGLGGGKAEAFDNESCELWPSRVSVCIPV